MNTFTQSSPRQQAASSTATTESSRRPRESLSQSHFNLDYHRPSSVRTSHPSPPRPSFDDEPSSVIRPPPLPPKAGKCTGTKKDRVFTFSTKKKR